MKNNLEIISNAQKTVKISIRKAKNYINSLMKKTTMKVCPKKFDLVSKNYLNVHVLFSQGKLLFSDKFIGNS